MLLAACGCASSGGDAGTSPATSSPPPRGRLQRGPGAGRHPPGAGADGPRRPCRRRLPARRPVAHGGRRAGRGRHGVRGRAPAGASAARPPRQGLDRERAGAAGAGLRADVPGRPADRGRLHRPVRRHERGQLPGQRLACRPIIREAAAVRRPAVLEPQRRRRRVRPGRPAVHRDGRRRQRGRPGQPRAEPGRAAGQDAADGHRPAAGRRSTRWACATPGGSRSTGRPATCGSATSGRGRGRRSTTCRRARRRATNFGWNLYEGDHEYNATSPAGPQFTNPVAEYSHELGCSVTGGFVYRGPSIPALDGRYVYGDYCSGRLVVARPRREAAAAGARGAGADVVRRGSGRPAVRRCRSPGRCSGSRAG